MKCSETKGANRERAKSLLNKQPMSHCLKLGFEFYHLATLPLCILSTLHVAVITE